MAGESQHIYSRRAHILAAGGKVLRRIRQHHGALAVRLARHFLNRKKLPRNIRSTRQAHKGCPRGNKPADTVRVQRPAAVKSGYFHLNISLSLFFQEGKHIAMVIKRGNHYLVFCPGKREAFGD